MKTLTVWDQEYLYYLAEEVIIGLRYKRYLYDEEGNDILDNLSDQERRAAIRQALDLQVELRETDYLNFRENRELRQISFSDAVNMPLHTIKGKYLKDILKKARNIMRKGTMTGDLNVSREIPDDYLDNLLALRWRENLKIWTIQWKNRTPDCPKGEEN